MQENIGLKRLNDWGLIVVDMQNDFLAAGGYYDRRDALDRQVAQGELSIEERNQIMVPPGSAPAGAFRLRSGTLKTMLDKVLRLIRHARANRRPIAYLRAVYGRDYDILPPFLSLEPDRLHYPCPPNRWGSELIEPLVKSYEARRPGSNERIFEKHTYDGFFQTDLLTFLNSHRVRTAIIVGVETQVCVFATAKSAALQQFNTVIVEDGVWTSREDLGMGALAIFREAYGSTAASQLILEDKLHA